MNVQFYFILGRTGRAGRRGKAITFYTDEDTPYLRRYSNKYFTRTNSKE